MAVLLVLTGLGAVAVGLVLLLVFQLLLGAFVVLGGLVVLARLVLSLGLYRLAVLLRR